MKRILIIEDNGDIRENIAEILELAGYESLTAPDGKKGIELAQQELPDLIICDIMMPELDGFGVLHILNKKEDTARIPFIFLTAKTERADMRKGMIMGADDYITKPFDDTELLDAIETRFKKSDLLNKEYNKGAEGLKDFIKDIKDLLNYVEEQDLHKMRTYRKKNDIYRAGDYPHHLYYIQSGKIKTFRTNLDGKELITGIYSSGDFLGYEAILKDQPFHDHSMAMEDCEILIIPRDVFQQLVLSNKEIAIKFIELLSSKVDEKEEQLLHLAYNTVRQRTAEALITLYNKLGDGGHQVKISREDLSNMVGTATESVIRVISDFKDEGILESKGGNLLIHDLNKLEQIKKWHIAR
jgi:CRP-like cAMP-binding protein